MRLAPFMRAYVPITDHFGSCVGAESPEMRFSFTVRQRHSAKPGY